MNAPHRRNACPGLSTPMATGDGLLARLLPVERIPLDRFVAFCAAARRHGNGTVEVTARGSLQVRGLTPRSAPLFAAEINALHMGADGIPVITDPLADETVAKIDLPGLARNLRCAIADAQLTLAPKVSVILDSGSAVHLDALSADVRLCAIQTEAGARIHIALAGNAETATPLGSAVPDEAVDVTVQILKVLAKHGAVRASDILDSGGIGEFRSAAGEHIAPAPPLPARPPAEPVALHALQDGLHALGIALAFGHAHADALSELAGIATVQGAHWARPAPGRALLFGGLSVAAADAVAQTATQLGFVVRADDPRRRIAACPGAPPCATGLIAARALAADIATAIHPGGEGIAIHISGCAKGCAHPAPCALTIVGDAKGCGIVHNGSARARPCHYVRPDDLTAEIKRIVDGTYELLHG